MEKNPTLQNKDLYQVANDYEQTKDMFDTDSYADGIYTSAVSSLNVQIHTVGYLDGVTVSAVSAENYATAEAKVDACEADQIIKK